MTQAPNQALKPSIWPLLLTAAAMMMITMGVRQSTGLFISPINTSTGLGIVSISFAAAIGQFMWGATQPLFGIAADKYGSIRVIVVGSLIMALGTALIPFMHTEAGLIMAMGILSAAGAGAASFSVLVGGMAKRIPVEKRSFASGFINAGSSFGQFVFAPLTQFIIGAAGWINAMFSLAALSLLALPLAWFLRETKKSKSIVTVEVSAKIESTINKSTGITLGKQLHIALRDRSYLCLHAGFFTCGFHIAFLVTHMPGEVALCSLPASVAAGSLAVIGLFNIAGSLIAGAMGQRYRMKYILAWMYASRAVMIVIFLFAPKTALTFYIFAAGLGFTWLATVPPTAGLVGKLFGVRYLATLFGLTIFSHQIGGFFGAWLGGLAFAHFGDYNWMWYADIMLATAAALINLPIREARVSRATTGPLT